jgi:hypothetical protein
MTYARDLVPEFGSCGQTPDILPGKTQHTLRVVHRKPPRGAAGEPYGPSLSDHTAVYYYCVINVDKPIPERHRSHMDELAVDRERFERYLQRLCEVVGHADRRWPLEAYLTGLLLSGERKSVEPMAAKRMRASSSAILLRWGVHHGAPAWLHHPVKVESARRCWWPATESRSTSSPGAGRDSCVEGPGFRAGSAAGTAPQESSGPRPHLQPHGIRLGRQRLKPPIVGSGT